MASNLHTTNGKIKWKEQRGEEKHESRAHALQFLEKRVGPNLGRDLITLSRKQRGWTHEKKLEVGRF